MRAASTVCKVFLWIVTAWYTLMQGMALYSLHLNNQTALSSGQEDAVYGLTALCIGAVLLAAGTVLFAALPRRLRWIALAVSGVSALMLVLVGLDLGRTFTPGIALSGETTGLTTFKLVRNHYGAALAPLFMLGAWLFDRAAFRQEQARAGQLRGGLHYDLSGGSVFADAEERISGEPPRRLKRSLRARLKKAEGGFADTDSAD